MRCIFSPCGLLERPNPPLGFQQQRPSQRVGPAGFAQWTERRRRWRRQGMEPAALRRAALAGCAGAEVPRGAALCGSLAPLVLSSPLRLAMQCPGKGRDPRGSRGTPRPCLGVAFRPFCSRGRGIEFCFCGRELGVGHFRLPRPGNSHRCHGTRHLLRGGGLPLHPALGAEHPPPARRDSGPRGSPALASYPARPPLGSIR